MNAAGRLAISAGTSQLDVSSNSPSRLTGSPSHHCVDVAAPPRLNAAPSTAGAPWGTVPATIVVVVEDVVVDDVDEGLATVDVVAEVEGASVGGAVVDGPARSAGRHSGRWLAVRRPASNRVPFSSSLPRVNIRPR